ncbi:MAG: TolC family protein [Ignavibacteriaceae bacterium]
MQQVKVRILLYFFLSLLFILPVNAQSVDSLVNEALQNNPQLKAMQEKIKSAEYKSEGAGFLPPPTVGIEFSQIPLEDANPFTKALSQSISVSQMFMPGGKLSAMKDAERKGISVAEKEYETYRLKLRAGVKSKYFEIWMMEHHIGLRDEIIALLNNLLQSTEQLYVTGSAKYSDILMIKAELAANKTQLEVLENDISASVYEMNAILGRDLNNDELAVSHTWKTDPTAYSAEELVEVLGSSNPELQRMEEMIEMNRLQITANNKELIPDFMLQGMIMRMPQGMILTSKSPVHALDGMGDTEYMYSIMASVTLPFMPWSSGKITAREEELTAAISGLSSEKYDMQRRMISELRGLLKKLESERKKIKLYSDEVIPLYRQALEAQVSEFQNARTSINDLINTMQMLLMKEEEMAEAQMQHEMILAEIESIAGSEL